MSQENRKRKDEQKIDGLKWGVAMQGVMQGAMQGAMQGQQTGNTIDPSLALAVRVGLSCTW